MLALAHHYDEPVAGAEGVTYRARVYGGEGVDGRWSGWILFFPVGGGRVISTPQETTQSSLADLGYWASGLTDTYLHGALSRALALEPEAELARELERLERLETSAELRAETLGLAADVARVESKLAGAERERTEERLLATVAASAETEAELHEAAARESRTEAQAADRALHARTSRAPAKKNTSSKKSSSKKKK